MCNCLLRQKILQGSEALAEMKIYIWQQSCKDAELSKGKCLLVRVSWVGFFFFFFFLAVPGTRGKNLSGLFVSANVEEEFSLHPQVKEPVPGEAPRLPPRSLSSVRLALTKKTLFVPRS